jgi:formate hydrogenlyase subunit 4
LLSVLLALSETLFAKMRLFRVQEFLSFAYLLGLLGMLSHIILEGAR